MKKETLKLAKELEEQISILKSSLSKDLTIGFKANGCTYNFCNERNIGGDKISAEIAKRALLIARIYIEHEIKEQIEKLEKEIENL